MCPRIIASAPANGVLGLLQNEHAQPDVNLDSHWQQAAKRCRLWPCRGLELDIPGRAIRHVGWQSPCRCGTTLTHAQGPWCHARRLGGGHSHQCQKVQSDLSILTAPVKASSYCSSAQAPYCTGIWADVFDDKGVVFYQAALHSRSLQPGLTVCVTLQQSSHCLLRIQQIKTTLDV